ncbi:MAG TPA: PadR family transcriptional regulator [Dehalococcoidia bacterium]|jgi:DNA-binding PadR family transcriptional regulator|nr:PadR family transcriptional regulator [Dehalococcoidia bacterium]
MPRRINSSRQTQALIAALLLESDSWQYGYDLSRATGLRSGTLYPILIRLENQGWLEARWEVPAPGKPPRHLYRLTALGLQEASSVHQPAVESSKVSALRPVEEGGSS